jgi:hypothetical protein
VVENLPEGIFYDQIRKVISVSDIAKDGLDEWMYFLKNESIRPEFSAKGLAEAKDRLDVLNLDDQQRREYEYWQMELHQRASMVKSYYGRVDLLVLQGHQRCIVVIISQEKSGCFGGRVKETILRN